MKILFLGYSSLFKRKLIPVVNELSEVEEVHITKFNDQQWDNDHSKIIKKTHLYDTYDEGLNNSNADIAYITSVNSSHYELALKCLEKGMHVVVDKPITLSYEQTYDLIEKSKTLGKTPLLLAESLVYTYHPQFKCINDIFEEKKEKIKTIQALFSIPEMDSNNFRYNKDLGGGAINDMGPYAVSVGRYFFGEEPIRIRCIVYEKKNDVEISFSMLAEYRGNRIVKGYFGFDTKYINSLKLLGNNIKIDINRVFSIPSDMHPLIDINYKGQVSISSLKPADNFVLFFKDVLNAIKEKDYSRFTKNVLADSKTLDQLRSTN